MLSPHVIGILLSFIEQILTRLGTKLKKNAKEENVFPVLFSILLRWMAAVTFQKLVKMSDCSYAFILN